MVDYFLPDGYIENPVGLYVEVGDDTEWQPDVYLLAAELAREAGSVRIVDFGCSTAGKLLALADEFDIVGVDLPTNLPDDPRGEWVAHDFDSTDELALDFARSWLVCSDVIEHLAHPERLVRQLVAALGTADGLVLSTPDRTRTRGVGHLGPSPNGTHVREWDADELIRFLESQGLVVESQTWQRSYRGAPVEATTVVVCRGGEQWLSHR